MNTKTFAKTVPEAPNSPSCTTYNYSRTLRILLQYDQVTSANLREGKQQY